MVWIITFFGPNTWSLTPQKELSWNRLRFRSELKADEPKIRDCDEHVKMLGHVTWSMINVFSDVVVGGLHDLTYSSYFRMIWTAFATQPKLQKIFAPCFAPIFGAIRFQPCLKSSYKIVGEIVSKVCSGCWQILESFNWRPWLLVVCLHAAAKSKLWYS